MSGIYLNYSAAISRPPVSGRFFVAAVGLLVPRSIYPSTTTGVANAQIVLLLNGATCRVGVCETGTSGTWACYTRNVVVTYTQLGSNLTTGLSSAVTAVDIHLVYGTSGRRPSISAALRPTPCRASPRPTARRPSSGRTGRHRQGRTTHLVRAHGGGQRHPRPGLWLINSSTAGNAQRGPARRRTSTSRRSLIGPTSLRRARA